MHARSKYGLKRPPSQKQRRNYLEKLRKQPKTIEPSTKKAPRSSTALQIAVSHPAVEGKMGWLGIQFLRKQTTAAMTILAKKGTRDLAFYGLARSRIFRILLPYININVISILPVNIKMVVCRFYQQGRCKFGGKLPFKSSSRVHLTISGRPV